MFWDVTVNPNKLDMDLAVIEEQIREEEPHVMYPPEQIGTPEDPDTPEGPGGAEDPDSPEDPGQGSGQDPDGTQEDPAKEPGKDGGAEAAPDTGDGMTVLPCAAGLAVSGSMFLHLLTGSRRRKNRF